MARICFYDSTPLDEEQLSQSLKSTDHYWYFVEDKISMDNLDPECEVVSIFVTSTITKEMLDQMPKLRLIACRSTGFNNVDLAAAAEKGIQVVNVPSYGDTTVAEYAFTLLLALYRKIPQVLQIDNADYDTAQLLGEDLYGKTLGVVGTGRIGQRAIAIAKGFGMKVIAYDAYPQQTLESTLDFTYGTLEEVLSQSDAVTLHLPFLPSTHKILNKERLQLLKPSAVLINTARGELVDTSALIEALENKQLAGAGLDVIEGEALLKYDEEILLLRQKQVPPELLKHSVELSILKKMPQVILSPHTAFNTTGAIKRINATTATNIIDFWYGTVPNAIAPQTKSLGKLLIARHTESEWNVTGQWTGTRDVHLSEKGFRDSGRLGQLLQSLDVPIDIAYCSQQIRTRETLEGVLDAAQLFSVDIVREAALNERDYGDYTGKNKWEMKDAIGEEAWNAVRRGWDVAVPNGETLRMVYGRVVPFYLETIVPILQSGKNVLLVAHGNSLRALMKYIETISDQEVENLEMLFGHIVMYDISSDGTQTAKIVHQIETTPTHA